MAGLKISAMTPHVGAFTEGDIPAVIAGNNKKVSLQQIKDSIPLPSLESLGAVGIAGAQTITGAKTFEGGLIVGSTELTEAGIINKDMSMTTGLYEFGGISVTSGTTFSVGAVKGYVIDNTDVTNPVPIYVEYAGATGLTTPYIASSFATYISLDEDGLLVMSSSEPEPDFYRSHILLGVIGHPSGTLTGAGNKPDVIIGGMDQVRDMFRPIRFINDGVVCYGNGSDLALANTTGKLYGLGIGFVANGKDNPSSITIAAGAPTTFQYRTQLGGSFSNTTLIIPSSYDNAGTVTAVGGGANSSTNQRIYLLQNGMIRIQFGQFVYSTLTDAIAAAQSEAFVVNPNTRLGVLIGILSITKGCTNLSSTSTARFLAVSKFGESVGAAAGIAIGTLQSSYDNSVIPNILTNSTLGAFSVRRGSAADTDKVLDILNGAGSSVFSVTGAGNVASANLFTQGGNAFGTTATIGTNEAQELALETNNVARVRIDANGNMAIGGAPSTNRTLLITKTLTGTTTGIDNTLNSTIASDVTGVRYGVFSQGNTQAAAFTLPDNIHFTAEGAVIGAGSAITNQIGFKAGSSLTTASNNYGFRGLISAGAGRWNLYMDGDASNHLAGALSIGSTTIPASVLLQVASTTKGSIPAPVMTTTQRDAIGSPVAGLMVYNSVTLSPNYHNGTTWVDLGAGGFIQNTTVAQTGSFNVTGTGRVATSMQIATTTAPSGAEKLMLGGDINFTATNPKIIGLSKHLQLELLSSSGRFTCTTAGTVGMYLNHQRGDCDLVNIRTSTQETGGNRISFIHKETSLSTETFGGNVGYMFGVNTSISTSSVGKMDATKASYQDLYPLVLAAGSIKKWTKIEGTDVWKEYGTKTELYPTTSASTVQIGSATIIMSNLPTYADNTAAAALAAGTVYKTATGQLMIKY